MASSAPIPAPRGLVVCSAHNAQRKGEFCEMKPVMNADMEVIDYVCVCKPAFRCKSAAERNGNVGHDEATGTTSPPPPVIMDASSTSVSAHRTHPHATSASAAAAGGAGEADIGTLFAVSFYDTSRPAAGASPSPQQGADASAAAAAAPKDGNPGSVAAATAAAAVAISDSDDAPESEADSLESVPHITPGVAAVPGPSAAPTAPRGRPRYYDAAQGQGGERGGGGGGAGAGGGHASPVKVCWSCGMPGHEKPSCPNILCRTCHQKRGPYGTPHRCGFVQTPSPFLVNPTAAEWRAATAGTDMSAVRCVACNGLGHLDCSVAVTPSSYALVALSASSASSDGIGEAAVPQTVVATCCFCGVRGHTVHDCRQRERVNPDNFERRQQVAASDTEHRGTSSGFGMGGYQGSHNNSYGYSSQQQQPPYQRYPQQQQQQQQRSYGGSSSAPYARYGNDRDRDRGGQRREREWDDNSNHNYRDRRDQRGGGYAETHSRYEGGERHEHQRRRFDSGPSSPAPTSSYSRDRYPSAGGGGGGRAPHQQWEQQGGASSASRSHDHSSHHPHHQHSRRDQHSSTGSSHQQQPRSNTGWKGRGGRRGNSGYDSGDDLF